MVKKVIILFLIIVMNICFIGCNNKKPISKDLQKEISFNQSIAKQIVLNYMSYLKKGDYESARKLCSPNLANRNKEIYEDELGVYSYKILELSQRADITTIKVLVNRSKRGTPQTGLDTITFKVKQNQDDLYEIVSAVGATKCQVYVDKGTLKLLDRGAKEASPKDIVKLEGLPKMTYVNLDKSDIKLSVPNKEFSGADFSLNLDKIAISSTDGKDSFVGIAVIDEAIEVQGKSGGEGKNENGKDGEKGICKKLIALDTYRDIRIEEMYFTAEDNYLIVDTISKMNIRDMKIYDINTELQIQTNFKEMFPEDKYELFFVSNSGVDSIIFDVKAKKDASQIRRDALGKYKINLKELKIEKV